jgi:glycosyltransferase involved in cell wall biosynthesis
MRVLWIAPWGRALARVYLDEMVRQGHEVLLVTTARHYEKQPEGCAYEQVVTGNLRQPASWPSVANAIGAARRFRPDVVVAEEFHDPRLLPLLGAAPLATLVHDDAPHGEAETKAWHHRLVFRRTSRRADLLVAFSEHVAAAVRGRSSRPTVTVALPSDAGEQHVPPIVAAPQRRDFVLIGRIGPYKNVPVTLEAWRRHVGSPAYRDDRLLIIGDGPAESVGPLPQACEWRRSRFQFAELMPVLATAKASLAYYTSATQSGVQVISMQCATSALVADVGGLPEYLPPGEKPVPVDDPAGLALAIGQLADPEVAAARGRAARDHYDSVHHPAPATAQLLEALHRLRAGRAPTGGPR